MCISGHKRYFMSLACHLTLGNLFQEYALKETGACVWHDFSVSLCMLETAQAFKHRGNRLTNSGTSVNKITSCCFYNHEF